MASLEGWNFTIKLCPQRERKSAATTRDCQAIFPRSTRVCYLISHGLASGMRNFLSFGAAIFFGFLISVRADLTIVQRVEGAGQDGEVTVKIKGDKERIDAASQPSRIIDAKTGEMTDLINDQKTYVKISAAQIKAAALAANPDSAKKSGPPKLTPSGKKEKISGYDTEEYLLQAPQFTASFWVATKYPDAANILKEMEGPMSGPWKPATMGMPDYSDFAGVPLKTVISVGSNQVVTTILSIKHDAVSSSEFDIPKDFQELKKPMQPVPQPGDESSSSPTP